ncbi:hypothetical protein B296_00003063 [Ensete ventricosum]|uniref:Uncharacterized protein n=1 Tax=Ensete ventricosum TaxID=4639 RepID=A0A427B7P8_ENSVE|nr:hypothetical protein B296_00003063 [Ensete ventricosum]
MLGPSCIYIITAQISPFPAIATLAVSSPISSSTVVTSSSELQEANTVKKPFCTVAYRYLAILLTTHKLTIETIVSSLTSSSAIVSSSLGL